MSRTRLPSRDRTLSDQCGRRRDIGVLDEGAARETKSDLERVRDGCRVEAPSVVSLTPVAEYVEYDAIVVSPPLSDSVMSGSTSQPRNAGGCPQPLHGTPSLTSCSGRRRGKRPLFAWLVVAEIVKAAAAD